MLPVQVNFNLKLSISPNVSPKHNRMVVNTSSKLNLKVSHKLTNKSFKIQFTPSQDHIKEMLKPNHKNTKEPQNQEKRVKT